MLGTSTGMQSLYVYDGTGNPAALITSSPTIAFAYDYDPYGVPTLTADSGGLGTSQNPYTLKAGIQDRVTGWVKYGQPWYNPTTGRWTQQDTLDAPLNPKNANRYAYAANDPINNTDPLGLITADVSAEAGFFFCGSIGVITGEDQVPHLVLGFGVGPKESVGVNIGSGTGYVSTGFGLSGSCDAAFGGGAYLQGSIDSGGNPSGGGGAAFGQGIGCSVGGTWTF